MATTATPKKPILKFPRNQCIASNKNILDRYHLFCYLERGRRQEIYVQSLKDLQR